MIKSIKIQNYKLFKSFDLQNIPQILLVGGKNNSGKTSILEAAFMSLDCVNPNMFIRHLGRRGLNTISNDVESLFGPVYHNFDLNQPIIIQYTLNSAQKKLIYKFLPFVTQPIITRNGSSIEINEKVSRFGGIEISYWLGREQYHKALLKHEIKGLNLSSVNQVLKYNEGVKAVFLASTFSDHQSENARRYGELDRINNTANILTALKILESKLNSLSVIPMGNRSMIYGDTGLGKKIPLALMGQGINKLVSILLAISNANNGVVFIDELENGFHHSVLSDIWKVISHHAMFNNTQVIATTHSRELILGAVAGIPDRIRDKFKYMRIERKGNVFKTKHYDFNTLSAALDSELEIR